MIIQRGVPRAKGHVCEQPGEIWLLFHWAYRNGTVWECDECGRRWQLHKNEYGDYFGWADVGLCALGMHFHSQKKAAEAREARLMETR